MWNAIHIISKPFLHEKCGSSLQFLVSRMLFTMLMDCFVLLW
jgi:hypothetical protein